MQAAIRVLISIKPSQRASVYSWIATEITAVTPHGVAALPDRNIGNGRLEAALATRRPRGPDRRNHRRPVSHLYLRSAVRPAVQPLSGPRPGAVAVSHRHAADVSGGARRGGAPHRPGH